MSVKAYLEITMVINNANRPAAKVYTDYRQPFLNQIKGALTKSFLSVTKMYRFFMVLTASKMQRPISTPICLKMMYLSG